MKPVKIIHRCVGESRDASKTREFNPGTEGQYVAHVPLGMIVLRIDDEEWVIHPAATDAGA